MDSHTPFADGDDLVHMQGAEVRFGGDFGLQEGTQRLTEQITENTERYCKGQHPESPSQGFGATKWEPG